MKKGRICPENEPKLIYKARKKCVYCVGVKGEHLRVPGGYEEQIAKALNAAASNGWYYALDHLQDYLTDLT